MFCVASVATGAALFWLSDNPFLLSFRTGAALIVLGLCGCATVALIVIMRSRHLVLKGLGAIILSIAVGLAIAGLILLHRNRLLWPSKLSIQDWETDAKYLTDLIPRAHPNAFANLSPRVFRDQAAEAQAQIPSRSEAEVEMSLVRLVASIQDGHSTLFPFQPAAGFRMLPLQIYLFSDGWYITDSSPKYRNVVGKHLLRLGAKRIEEAFAIVHPFVGADNESTVQDRAPLYLLCPEVLQALGIVSGANVVRLTIADESGNLSEVDVRPTSLIRYLYWYFEPLQQWKRKPPQSASPLYRQYTWDNYWFRYLEEGRTVYVAFNQVRDKSDESFERFGDRVLQYCKARGAERLIIDIRNNDGGDNTIFGDFIQKLRNHPMNARGKLYVIIGRHTFSAAVNFTSAMESETNAIFVGEPAGAGPNHYGDPKKYVLPFSRLWVFIASRYHQWGQPQDRRRAHEPSITVPVSHVDYFANRDPVLAAILSQPTK